MVCDGGTAAATAGGEDEEVEGTCEGLRGVGKEARWSRAFNTARTFGEGVGAVAWGALGNALLRAVRTRGCEKEARGEVGDGDGDAAEGSSSGALKRSMMSCTSSRGGKGLVMEREGDLLLQHAVQDVTQTAA